MVGNVEHLELFGHWGEPFKAALGHWGTLFRLAQDPCLALLQ